MLGASTGAGSSAARAVDVPDDVEPRRYAASTARVVAAVTTKLRTLNVTVVPMSTTP